MTSDDVKIPMAVLLGRLGQTLREMVTHADVAADDLETHSIFAAAGGVVIIEEQLADVDALVKALRVLVQAVRR